jgi:hypothetical protein
MSAETTNTYTYVPAILRGTQIALPDGMHLGDIDWGEPTEPEEIALRARIIFRIQKMTAEQTRTYRPSQSRSR